MNTGCIFCTKIKPLTREHVLPDWLCDLYPGEFLVTNEFIGKDNKVWTSKIFQHKAKNSMQPMQ